MIKKEKIISYFASSVIFLLIWVIYAFDLEKALIIRMNIAKLNTYIPIPAFFFGIIFTYIYFYAKLFKKKLRESFYLIFPLALFWQLAFFAIEMIGVDPWNGNKAIFTIYSHIYLTAVIALCFVISYKLIDYFSEAGKPNITIPGFALVIYLAYFIIRSRSYAYLILIPAGFLIINFLRKRITLLKSINSRRRDLLFIILVFILAFALRLGWGARLVSLTQDNFYAASDDGINYGRYAEDWVKGKDNSPLCTFSGFGYWVFLGFIYSLFGNPNYYAVIFIQALLGALVAVFVYKIAKRLTNFAIAISSAILVALNMNSIFTSSVIGMEALFIPLVYLSLCLLIEFIHNGKIKFFKYPFLIGILLGLANIVRFEVTFIFIIISIGFFLFRRGRFKARESLKISSAFAAGFLMVLLLFCWRNYIKEGKFDFKSNSAAIGFALLSSGNVQETQLLCAMGFNPFMDLGGSLQVGIKHPLAVGSLLMKGVVKKGINYLFVANFGEMDFLTLLNNAEMEPPFRFPLYCQFYIYFFTLLGLIILVLDKKYLLEKSILFGYILYTLLIYALIWAGNARYRATLEPLFIIFFVTAVYAVGSNFRRIVMQRG
ncbi:MAG: glycosyltransferase family 39 protein [Candidatus Omnitrophica bacterium]|nr:glycosyltransferase family 39 protein [Candidatus Omnitrophota bacterium]